MLLPVAKVSSDVHFKDQAEIFMKQSTNEEVMKVGEEAIASLYNGVPFKGLNLLRYRRFTQKVTLGTTFIQIHTLPPKSAAAKFHNLRVYLQVQQWIGQGDTLVPHAWGWYTDTERSKLLPVTTDLPPAPEHLMKVVRCQCKTGCDTKQCSCRKHGLECTPSCGECKGVSCSNAQVITDTDATEEVWASLTNKMCVFCYNKYFKIIYSVFKN